MIESTPELVFKISELTRVIATHLVLTDNGGGAVNLACASRYLEEPVLSTLWEMQLSLCTLLRVLPRGTWEFGYVEDENRNVFRIVGDPSPVAWNRLWRYASWMRRFCSDSWVALGEDTIHKLRFNSPAGGLFPALKDCYWWITECNLPHADLFLSQNLKKIHISMSLLEEPENLHKILPTIALAISELPASTLQHLRVDTGRGVPWAHLKDSLSSVVLRCGPSLTEFSSQIPLSDAAVGHLIHLPYLNTWHVEGLPPSYSPSSFPLDFPPLVKFVLGEGAARGWLSMLKRLEAHVSPAQGTAPLSKTKESLKYLKITQLTSLIVDVPLASSIRMFRNLVDLDISTFPNEGEDQCTFKLNNEDVAGLAMSLPQLESLLLGYPCDKNTCVTTVACLLQISVHCIKLQKLGIHFSTTNIVDEFKSLSEDSRFRELRSLPRCPLQRLELHRISLVINELEYGSVVNGMISIFPSLELLMGFGMVYWALEAR